MNIEVKKTEQASTNLRIELKNIPDMTIISYRVFVTEDNVLYSGFDRKIAQEMYEELNKAAAGTGVKPKYEYKCVKVKDLPKGTKMEDIIKMLPPIIADLIVRSATNVPATMSNIEEAKTKYPGYFNSIATRLSELNNEAIALQKMISNGNERHRNQK